MTLKFIRETARENACAVRQESARAASARDYPESIPERRVSLLKFCENRPLKAILVPVLRFQWYIRYGKKFVAIF